LRKSKKLFLFQSRPRHDDETSTDVAGPGNSVAIHGATLEVDAAREGVEVTLQYDRHQEAVPEKINWLEAVPAQRKIELGGIGSGNNVV